jgi:peroxiredoxin
MLKPRQAVPPLEVTTLGGRAWKLAEQKPDSFTMVVFYRGLHSPQCSRYLKGLADQLGAFAQRGVEVIAISADERARRAGQAAVGTGWPRDRLRPLARSGARLGPVHLPIRAA